MANEFTKLTEKEVVESVSENGHLFAEDGGKIVRIPAAGVGGGMTAYHAFWPYMYHDEEQQMKVSREEFLTAASKGSIYILDHDYEYFNGEYMLVVSLSDDGDYATASFVSNGSGSVGIKHIKTSEYVDSGEG